MKTIKIWLSDILIKNAIEGMMKFLYVLVAFFFFSSCEEKKPFSLQPNYQEQKELILIFDRYRVNTIQKSFSNDFSKDVYYVRENFAPPFEDPNLHIKVFHDLDQGKKTILRKELDEMEVWFDSEMGYLDWFRLNFEKYYIIYQDEYLVKGSLDPSYEFTAYEVKISTGGTE